MKFYIKYDFNKACNKILQEQLDLMGVKYTLHGPREVEITQVVSEARLNKLAEGLGNYGIEMVDSQRNVLVQKIKDAVIELIFMEEKLPTAKISAYLADKLKYSYGYLSNLFSEVTYTSIENFIILQKTEKAKQLITSSELSVTEIAWKLNYSSVSHFCTQFKSVTGLTPTAFQRIIRKRQVTRNNKKFHDTMLNLSPENT